MPINVQAGSRLYSYQDNTKPNVWMSHGDEATKLPDGFSVVAKSEQVRRGTEQDGARRAGRGGGGMVRTQKHMQGSSSDSKCCNSKCGNPQLVG